MRTIRPALALALFACASAACYAQDPAAGQSTFPEPVEVTGPPGGGMDPGPGYPPGYQAPQPYQAAQAAPYYPGYPQGYPDGTYTDQSAGYADPDAGYGDAGGNVDPSQQAAVDPQGGTYAMGPVTDEEIDATLSSYGAWVEDPEYGRVWRPDATVVGVDFTPYDTCGSWVYTEYGWTFDCEWDWGWLPFHYGQWAWFDAGYWGWVPGYQWSPAWVDWRSGGGYIGWRPSEPRVRDHRTPRVRDHRHHPSNWRFASRSDFGRPHIWSHLLNNPAEGLRVTRPGRPTFHPPGRPANVAGLMHNRFARGSWRATRGPRAVGTRPATSRPTWQRPAVRQPTWQRPAVNRAPTWQRPAVRQPTWQRPAATTYRPPVRTYRPPVQTYRPPVRTYRPPVQTYRPPVRTYRPPAQAYHPPVRPVRPPSSTFHPPAHFSPPSRPSFRPSRPSFTPSHSSFTPSHSSFSGGHSSAHSGGGRSFSGGHSSGGHSSGGRHR